MAKAWKEYNKLSGNLLATFEELDDKSFSSQQQFFVALNQ